MYKMISLGCYVKNELLIKSKLPLILQVVLVVVAFGIEKVASLGGVNGYGKHDETSQSEVSFYMGNRSQFANFKSCEGNPCTVAKDDCCENYECKCKSCKPLEAKCNEIEDICCGHKKYQNYCKYKKNDNRQGTCEKCAKVGESCDPRKQQIDCCKVLVDEVNPGYGNVCKHNEQKCTCTKCKLTGESCEKDEDCCKFNYSEGDEHCVEKETTKEKHCVSLIRDVPADLKSTHMKL